jgi:heme exporter protein D
MPHGDYGVYVWPAYGISAAVILGLLVDSLLRARSWRRKAQAERRGEGLR